jgi:hypothetical protein
MISIYTYIYYILYKYTYIHLFIYVCMYVCVLYIYMYVYIHYSVHGLYVYDYACMLFYCICLIHLHAYRRGFVLVSFYGFPRRIMYHSWQISPVFWKYIYSCLMTIWVLADLCSWPRMKGSKARLNKSPSYD